MIDPLLALAYSLHTNRGVYALLLGSGVSRAASVPTGWEIVLDLIQKLAVMQGDAAPANAANWFRERYGEEPDYSAILEQLAKSPEERQRLLSAYFEPTEDEREEGLKLPTDGHRAIARMVASGHIRVVLTTNFDRLIERAIEDEGVTPVVLSTPDAIEGALPLVHQQCCVIKLHGDYLDTRIKNSPDELATYDPRVDHILDQVLDEFGLLICGWSGQWDEALRAALQRCKSRRFTTYWAIRGSLADEAGKLVDLRSAVTIPITNADDLFQSLSDKLLSLEELSQPHPLSVAAATASAKRLLADDKHLIRLDDLIRNETEQAFATLQDSFARLIGQGDQKAKFAAAISEFAEAIKIIRAIAVQVSKWGTSHHHGMLAQMITRLAQDPKEGQSGTHLVDELRVIPSVMILYTAGIAALASANYGTLAALLTQPRANTRRDRQSYLTAVDWPSVQERFKSLEGHERQFYPASEWLFEECRGSLDALQLSDIEYERTFDLFETIRSLVFIDLEASRDGQPVEGERWGPPGRFAWKLVHRGEREDYLSLVKTEPGLATGLASAGLFGGQESGVHAVVDSFAPMVAKFRHW